MSVTLAFFRQVIHTQLQIDYQKMKNLCTFTTVLLLFVQDTFLLNRKCFNGKQHDFHIIKWLSYSNSDFAQIFLSFFSFSRKNQFHFNNEFKCCHTILSRSGSHFESFSFVVVSISCSRSLLPDLGDAIYYRIYFRRLLIQVRAIRRLVIQGSKTVR